MRASKYAALIVATAAALSITIAGCSGGPSGVDTSEGPADTVEMNIQTFGGELGDAIAEVAKGFEEEHNVRINWVSGTGVENVARAAARASNQIYDVTFSPDSGQVSGSAMGLWEMLDRTIVDTDDVYPVLLKESDDGAPMGMIVTSLYYNTEVFEQEGWPAPTSFADLARPEYCDRVGIIDPNSTYGMYTVLGLGGLTQADAIAGNLQPAWDRGLGVLESMSDCLTNVESSSSAFEQKIQAGQYAVGAHGHVRLLALEDAGVPIQAIAPSEGSFLTLSTVSANKGGPNPELAQEFVNWFISEESQTSLMNLIYYGPVLSTVDVPGELANRGVPGNSVIDALIVPDLNTVDELRSDWFDQFQRAIGQ